MIVVTTETIAGHRVHRTLGQVFGVTIERLVTNATARGANLPIGAPSIPF